jgi:hypothetical protein
MLTIGISLSLMELSLLVPIQYFQVDSNNRHCDCLIHPQTLAALRDRATHDPDETVREFARTLLRHRTKDSIKRQLTIAAVNIKILWYSGRKTQQPEHDGDRLNRKKLPALLYPPE